MYIASRYSNAGEEHISWDIIIIYQICIWNPVNAELETILVK